MGFAHFYFELAHRIDYNSKRGEVFMKSKHLSNRFMGFLTNIVIVLLPILVWDILILFVLAGILPAVVMNFLDSLVKYVLIVFLLLATPFIALTYHQTFGYAAFDLKVVDLKNKKASVFQVALREVIGWEIPVVAIYVFAGMKYIPIYFVLNFIVILIDPLGRGIADFICHTKVVHVAIEENVRTEKAKKTKRELFHKKESVKKENKPEGSTPLKTNAGIFHIDLHMHSKYSDDGEYTVEELFMKAKENGLDIISITDHNCVKANYEAKVLSEAVGIRYIPGIEIDATYEGYDLHVLGYCIDFKDPRYIQLENQNVKKERDASLERVEKFEKMSGMKLNVPKLLEMNVNGIITGEMIAEDVLSNPLYENSDLLLPYRAGGERSDNPYVNFYWDFFAQGKACYVKIEYPSLPEIVRLIQETGGYAILAHPKKPFKQDKEMILKVMECGVRGLEVFSSYHSPKDIAFYMDIVKDASCFVTCGSDFHGKTKPAIQLGASNATSKHENLIHVFIHRCLN